MISQYEAKYIELEGHWRFNRYKFTFIIPQITREAICSKINLGPKLHKKLTNC